MVEELASALVAVVIHESVNDVEPRNWPGFHPDYSHYRRPWREEGVRCLLLSGAGKNFSAGADLEHLRSLRDEVTGTPSVRVEETALKLETIGVPSLFSERTRR